MIRHIKVHVGRMDPFVKMVVVVDHIRIVVLTLPVIIVVVANMIGMPIVTYINHILDVDHNHVGKMEKTALLVFHVTLVVMVGWVVMIFLLPRNVVKIHV